jgi:hypothetical protein
VRSFLLRAASLLAVLAVAATVAQSGSGAPKRIMSCSTNGGFTTCQYYNGTMPAYAGGSCCVAFNADSGYNYWQTNKMWRPSGSASIYYFNASGVVGYYSSPTDNPLVVHGSYGYSDGFCENDTGSSMSSVTCQDYNWNA